MKDIRIKKSLNQNFTHVSYVNTLDDVISIYKSKIITKFPWAEELFVEVLVNYPISSGIFNPNEKKKTLGILIGFQAIPVIPEFERIIKDIFEGGLNQIYP